MWKYVKRYFFYAVLAGLFMIGEVMMDLIQPQIMGQIVDDHTGFFQAKAY